MTFDPVPSLPLVRALRVEVVPPDAPARTVGVGVTSDGDLPAGIGLDRDALAAWGFRATPGATLALPRAGDDTSLVLVGLGPAAEVGPAVLRDAAAAFARADGRAAHLVTDLATAPTGGTPDVAAAAQAVVEGVVLGRYRYDPLRSEADTVPVERLDLRVPQDAADAARTGAARGLVLARAAALSRDLANTPAGHLTAPDVADVARRLATDAGLDVTVHDKESLLALGCGGLLGVNAGSAVEPRMVVLHYVPDGDAEPGHLGFVGKGITYDSGGISLKPSNAMHAAMKMDMTGAGAVLAAMTVLRELHVPVRVSAYLALTDNMPSATATKLGDVLVTRAGRTIEVVNTDAEGRLVMSDAITLAQEDGVDAIVDIATLTGACLAALGPLTAGLLGNDDRVQGLVEDAADATDERVWRLPLDRRYRSWMDSEVADIKNLGGEFAGAITAALFLAEWVGDTPWAHLDIAGPMRSDKDDAWRTKGATGFGARLLAEVASAYRAPA
ncbi:leucyl aminopeptidase [Cellulomonas fimi]|uniref:leucyl aminopeptidase n=1 Tax=Cellulomonas fimi TaxID=1708 RepID=UPI00235828BF|nr:leucyl aminopeptidase [Cellulomonas fimi]